VGRLCTLDPEFVRRKLQEVEFQVVEAILFADGTLRVYFSSSARIPSWLFRVVYWLEIDGELVDAEFAEQLDCIDVERDTVVTAYAEFTTEIQSARPRRFELQEIDMTLLLSDVSEVA